MNAKQNEELHKERLSEIGKTTNIFAHEIRNSLTVMNNAVYIIKKCDNREANNVSMAEPLRIFENELKTMDKIVNDMLSFARNRPPVVSSFQVIPVIKEIIAGMPIQKDIKVELIQKEDIIINADKEEIKQVLRNLINNSVDSLSNKEKGMVSVSLKGIKIKTGSGSEDSVRISIIDNGCGMSQSQLHKLFKPFFSTKSKGTGLGLVVAQKIVEERHGGKINVESVEGKGTEITVDIPIVYKADRNGEIIS